MDQRWKAGWAGVGLTAALASAQEAPPELTELFPHVKANVAAQVIEIEGVVPIDCHDEETPDVFLEVVACTPGTKEHESLVLTKAKPSHIHAALLALGLEPGKPGAWDWDGETLTPQEPEGPKVGVEVIYINDQGERVEADIREWIVGVESAKAFPEEPGWLFAGSRMRMIGEREVYDADGTGMIVGLTTFGSEVVAWGKVISHEAEISEPEWIANRELVPAYETPVTLRLSVLKPKVESTTPADLGKLD